MYREIDRGELPAVHVGRQLRIEPTDLSRLGADAVTDLLQRHALDRTRGRTAAAVRACSDTGFVVDISSPAGRRAVSFSYAARTPGRAGGSKRQGVPMSHTIHGRIDLATGVYTPYAQAAPRAKPEPRPVDPETAAHEARHAAIALMHGVRVTEARADYPSPDTAGHVLYSADTDPRENALMILAGEMGQSGWPPDWPSRSARPGSDERRLAELVDKLDLDRRGWAALCAEAKNLVAGPGIDQLASMIEMFLAKGHVLNEDTLATFYNALCPPRSGVLAKFDATATGLKRKSFATATDTGAAGQFEALVAVFNNIDKGGDRIVPGAFTKTLAEWRASGDPVPVIWSHEWGRPDSHIGVSHAKDMQQTARGLHVKGQLDIDDNPIARRVHKLLRRRSVKEFSFGYSVPPGGQRKASDGANELIEIDLYEIGPTLKGMNPATELHSVKGIAQATDDTLKARFRAETYALLSDGDHEAGTLEDRFDRSRRAGISASCAASATE